MRQQSGGTEPHAVFLRCGFRRCLTHPGSAESRHELQRRGTSAASVKLVALGPSMTPPSELPPTSAPPPGVRHVLAVAGARGGVGTSVVAVNIAVYLAQLGRSVLLVDANAVGACLHNMLNVALPEMRPAEGELELDDFAPVDTPIPGLRLLPQLYSPGSTIPLRPGRKPRWAKKLRTLDVDYVLLDLGCSTAPSSLDLCLGADLAMLVCTPDPPSVEGCYRYCSALFQRRIRRMLMRDRFHLRLVDRAERTLPALPPPGALVRTLARFDTALGQLTARELSRLRPRLIVNAARNRSDTELGLAMHDMAERYLSIPLDYAGHIEHDDTVWLSVARRRPLLIDSPTSKSARNLERISRRVVALVARKEEPAVEPIALAQTEPTLYDVLLTHRGASDEELRRAYRRQRDIYKDGSLPITSLVRPEEVQKTLGLIDEAHDTLLDPLRRRAYDASTFPERDEPPEPTDPRKDAALEAERAMLREELEREVSAQTIFTGDLLRKVRESQGVELADIAQRTKISQVYLQAIEEERFAELPAFVYLRGFITEVAKYLKLDVMQVSRTYLRRYREWRNQHEHGHS
jgi:flagellar biosynthesis protein FlhG